MSRCTHRCVAEYLTAKRCRPIPAMYRPLGWHPGVFKLVCVTCGELMPLGPANDTPEVLVEVRAAAIVASEMPLPDDEWAGWLCHAYDDMIGAPARDGEWAGWLARVICTHDDAIRTLDAEARRG